MPATKVLPQFEAFGSYVDPFGAREKAMAFWLDGWRTGLGAAVWWSERWLQTVSAFLPASPSTASAPVPVLRPVAAIIDLAQAAAARTAADIGEVTVAAFEVVETVLESSVAVVEETVAALEPDPDDLTRMVGIGPKLSVALAERGVARFAHIAAWTEADLAEIDKALDLKGRAVRDAWVAQAKRFAAES